MKKVFGGFIVFLLMQLSCFSAILSAESTPGYIWWEAEDAVKTDFTSEMTFSPANKTEAKMLSGGEWIGVGPQTKKGFADYTVSVERAGTYKFYVRKFWKHGPFQWRFNEQPWQKITKEVALLDRVTMRTHVGANWVFAGEVTLEAGEQMLRVELSGAPEGAACFDVFCLTQIPFQARGVMKPDETYGEAPEGFFPFEPAYDSYAESPMDLRFLNEAEAGDGGFVGVDGDHFVQSQTGEPIRFWAVNTGHNLAKMDRSAIDSAARFLAKHGVNMVRIHGGIYNGSGPDASQVNAEKLDRVFYLVSALKKNGIYSGISIHFQHWLDVRQDARIPGYEESSNGRASAIHLFDPNFKGLLKSWWKATLTTPNPYTGKTLADDPAVGYCEVINEDNFFFWTFSPYKNIPAYYMPELERQFGVWLIEKYGSIEKAFSEWGPEKSAVRGDEVSEGRVGIYSAGALTGNDWAIAQRNPKRAEDCARFLAGLERDFFGEMQRYIQKDLGYGGPVCGSNMSTADHKVLTPLERWSNTSVDFLDHHGYYGGLLKQEDPPHFPVVVGDHYTDRSVLRFDPKGPGGGGQIPAIPFLAPTYNGKPSSCSEFAWNQPNQYQCEMNILAAVLGRTSGVDSMIFFVMGVSPQWSSRMNQYWPVQVPAVAGQWPAAALMYRTGLFSEGKTVVHAKLGLDKLFALEGSPVVAPKAGDDINEQMAPSGKNTGIEGQRVDPRAFVVGQVAVDFVPDQDTHEVETTAAQYVDEEKKVMTASTGEWTWGYDIGLLKLQATAAQGVCGFLAQAGDTDLPDLGIRSTMMYGNIVAVAMDDLPLKTSKKILLQVFSQSQDYGYLAEPATGMRTIKNRGRAPIIIKNFEGTVRFKRADADQLTVTLLDFNGYPLRSSTGAESIELDPNVLYYLIEAKQNDDKNDKI